MAARKEQAISVTQKLSGLIRFMGDVKSELAKMLGVASVSTTHPDEDMIYILGNEWMSYLEVEEMCRNFAREQAERDAAAGLKLAGVECKADGEDGWEKVTTMPKQLAKTTNEVGEYAKAEMTTYIGLDKVYHAGNGRMFNDVAQGQQLLAVGIESYILAYLNLVRQHAPHLVPRYVPR